ncbi:MAG: 50S ribosomal protein L31e [Candidatus Pacearchaeota archaeon]
MAKKTISNEKEYVISLRREILKVPKYKRTPKAIKAIKQFIARHMRIPERDLKKVKIDRFLNEELWFRGIKNPITKIKVKAKRDGEFIRVELLELPEKLKYKKTREEKVKKSAEEIKKQREERKTEESKDKKIEEKIIGEEKKEENDEKEKFTSSMEIKEKFAEQKHKEQKHVKKEVSPKSQHRMALKK